MKVTKYVVLWHEDNDSGTPKHVMGSSPVFDTEDEAKAWIAEAACVDRTRWDAKNTGKDFGYDTDDGEGIVHTYANYQHTYYKIEKIEWECLAADVVDEVKKILNGTRGFHEHEKYGTLTAYATPEERVRTALLYISDHDREWSPLREWAVDIHFCPAACIHHVMARTGEEAQQMVDDMLDNGALKLTEEQKTEIIDNLLENVESTELVGPEDD